MTPELLAPAGTVPLHHHFNKLGWSEVQIVQRFWLISILAVLFGVAISMV